MIRERMTGRREGHRWVALLSGALLAAPVAPSQAQAEARPNIVVMVADDLGWRDIGLTDGLPQQPFGEERSNRA